VSLVKTSELQWASYRQSAGWEWRWRHVWALQLSSWSRGVSARSALSELKLSDGQMATANLICSFGAHSRKLLKHVQRGAVCGRSVLVRTEWLLLAPAARRERTCLRASSDQSYYSSQDHMTLGLQTWDGSEFPASQGTARGKLPSRNPNLCLGSLTLEGVFRSPEDPAPADHSLMLALKAFLPISVKSLKRTSSIPPELTETMLYTALPLPPPLGARETLDNSDTWLQWVT